MPPNASSPGLDDLDNYFLDGDLDDDPFASPKRDKSDSNKRKEPGDGLGLDEEVSVAKRARAPRVKLDRDRLLSQKGIPALRRRARDLKLKGKGHEWGDASRLLSFYQEWLDDLFPKAKFLDALAMVEKVGHGRDLNKMRVDWINEGKPKSTVVEDGGDTQAADQDRQNENAATNKQAERIAPIFEKPGSVRPKTPELDDLFGGGDDIYNATPIGARGSGATTERGGEPNDDELDALMAEEEASARPNPTESTGGEYQSIFGSGRPRAAAAPARVEEDDDLDALIAEAEAEQASRQKPATAVDKSSKEATPQTGGVSGAANDEDDLDALMAEAEAHSEPVKKPGANPPAAKENAPEFNDEEEAMAEMDGLW